MCDRFCDQTQSALKIRQKAWFGVVGCQLDSSAISKQAVKISSNYQLNCEIADATYQFKKTPLISQLALSQTPGGYSLIWAI